MQYKFYAVDTDFSKKLFKEWQKLREPVVEYFTELTKEYNGACFAWDGDRITKIAFEIGEDEVPRDDKKGFLFTGVQRRTEDQKLVAVYKLDGRTKEGKKFKKQIEKYETLARERPCFSDYIVEKFKLPDFRVGVNHVGRTVIARSAAGFFKDRLVVKIPFTDEAPLPNVPEELVEIKKSEVVALVEE